MKQKLLTLTFALFFGGFLSAQTTCNIENLQGTYAGGFLQWSLNQGGIYLHNNPASLCGATYPYNITSVDLMIADGTAFGAGGGTGIGTLTYRVAIYASGAESPCPLPGALIATSGTISLNLTGAGLNPQSVPLTASVNGPFFVSYEPISWTGLTTQTPTVLWDNVPRPACKQMITQDSGANWFDFTDFFTGGETGFVDIDVNGTYTGGGSSACLNWVDPSPTQGYTNFNTLFGGAPCNDGTGCPFNEIITFEVWQSEAYAMANVVAGGSYTFSMCNGPGAGSWVPEFTILAPGGVIDAFGLGDGDGCSITWTASASGNYLIVINEAGNCGVAGVVNNGFPAITCNGTPLCNPPGDCSAGELASTAPQFICPGESAIFETDGTESVPSLPGGYAIVFTPTTGTGGIDDELILYEVDLPFSFDNDLNGVLSFFSLPPLAGEWSISGFAYTDDEDLEGTLCSETSESFLVTFLSAIDPLCGGTCPEGEIADCNGNCAPADWVGDGLCDDGEYTHNGIAIFFNCEEFDNDGGDCDPTLCPDGEIADCNGNCAPEIWLGDNDCDDGAYNWNGIPIFFNCEEFDYDNGDCPIPGDCTAWVEPTPTTGWSDFNNAPYTGAPVPVAGVCPFVEITAFQVWESEAYAMDNVTAQTCYTFSHCNGPGAGSWVPYYAIITPSGAVDYQGLGDGDGCSVTWIASETGTYLIVINEDGNCGVAGSTNNGYPAITCNGAGCLTVSVDETATNSFNIFPNPNNGQFVIDYVGENGVALIEVMDVAGKVIISNQQGVTSGSRVDMNVGNVRGMYFVRITMNNQAQVHKVVVN
jgi:hypothetical protein